VSGHEKDIDLKYNIAIFAMYATILSMGF